MDNQEMKNHLFDFVKGLIGAIAAGVVIAVTNYLGAHLPDIINFMLLWLGGVMGVKANR